MMAGCWTCRVRKKKCNHGLPSCSECLRLGIHCDGYGRRPLWADGGAQEAKYKRQLKDHIRRKAKNRRNDSLHQMSELIPSLTEFGDPEANGVRVFDNSFVDFLASSPVLISEFDLQMIEANGFQPNSVSLSSKSSDLPSLSPVAVDENPSVPILVGHDHDAPVATRQSENHSLPSFRNDFDVWQCEALIHYLDHLFWMQFPMCSKTLSQIDRTWVLVYMSRSALFKKALMQLSAAAMEKRNLPIETMFSNIQEKAETIHDLREELAVVASEYSSRTPSKITIPLAAAAMVTYQALIIGSSNNLTEVLSITQDLVDSLRQQLLNDENTTPTQKIAISFSLSQAIYVDTLHAATQRSTCILNDSQLLEFDLESDPDTRDIYGCSPWIIQALRKVIQLDIWKNELSKQGRLGVPELVSRGKELLEQLSSKTTSRRSSLFSGVVATNERERESSPTGSSRPELAAPVNSREIISQLYIKAASLYVHVIVSGANPHLPEIQMLVEDSINLLHGLRTLDIFACVVWPLMVITCLAAGECRESCRFIIMRAVEQEPLKRTFTQMLETAQECWRLANEAPLLQWDWRVAMSNVGVSSLAFILPL